MESSSVCVVGGGIAGLAAAATLAPDHDVTLLEADTFANATTSRASGVISLPLEPIDPATRQFIRGELADLDADGAITYTEVPALRLLEDDSTADIGGEHHDIEGLHARFPGVLGELEAYTGGTVLDGAGVLDPIDLAMAYKRRAEAAGATLLRDRRVEALLVTADSVTGVETSIGDVEADTVVWAAGEATRRHLEEHLTLPTRPLRWNALVIAADLDGPVPIGSDPTNRLYWRPYGDDAILVGGNEHLIDTVGDLPAGWAGEAAMAERSFEELASYEGMPATEVAPVDPSFIDLVEQVLPDLLAVDTPLEILRHDSCPSPDAATPDGLPIVDAPASAPDGLVVATGFHGRGIMLSPATGATIRELVTGTDAPFSTDPFALDRFEDRSSDFTYVSHWDA